MFLLNPYLVAPPPGGGAIPATVPLFAAYEADAETFSNNDVLTSLTDLSANGNNATQGTTANKGTGVTGQTINGGSHKAYRTNLTSGGTVAQWWNLPTMAALTSSSILAVVKSDTNAPGSSASQMIWFFGTQGDGNIWTYSDHHAYMGFGCNARQDGIGNIAEDISLWHVLEEESGSGANGYKLRLNGTIKYQNTVTTAFSSTPSISFGYRAFAGFGFVGNYAAIYIGSAKWTTGQRTDLVTYVNAKYGFSIS